MDVILHLGAHRTGSTSFQDALRRNAGRLADASVGFWGPRRTRGGLLSGALPQPGFDPVRATRRAKGRVRMQLDQTAASGLSALLISDENMIGSVRSNIRNRTLYADIGDRMARYAQVFDGRITRIVLNIRALDLWWSSAIAYGVSRGAPVPDYQALNRIAQARRSWRDVITDLACAMPHVDLRILPFEVFAGRTGAILDAGAGCTVALPAQGDWLNRSPDVAALRDLLAARGGIAAQAVTGSGRWTPFTPEHSAALRAAYADDLAWLAAGADGLASLTQDPERTRAGQTLPCVPQTEGHDYDRQKGDRQKSGLAHSGRG
ncbi:hypothetical protein SULPSESMR1_00661 [Pseudosulfitobacter pseudonitzschiae]|uniref:Sulfotransferase family protein n=2 Tax=Rhodobacterales TaxID=204455 RepID=A0A221JXX1_9RHOB|nr:hypothetical protein SULPSESMR1_00661 [Pseudosulfitobacter pseudonitzschiae]